MVLPALALGLALLATSTASADLRLSLAMDSMANKLFAEVSRQPGNVVISPLSVFAAMSVLHRGAGRSSRTRLQLHIATLGAGEEDGAALQTVISDYGQQMGNDTTLTMANALFANKALGKLKDSFKIEVKDQLDAKVKKVDFKKPVETAEAINSWVAAKTNNFIPKLVNDKSLDIDTSLMVLNAVYFKAMWAKAFERNQSRQDRFEVPHLGGHIITNIMEVTETIKTAVVANLQATSVVLDYSDRNYSMILLLPDDDLASLEERLASSQTRLKDLVAGARHRYTRLTMPSFNIDFQTSLVQPFMALGVTEAFDTRRANFSGITDKRGLAVSNIFHKVVLEVNEEGSEAAAVTGIVLDIRVARVPHIININRPFIFYVYDNFHDLPLFMGKVVDPSNGAAEVLHENSTPKPTDTIFNDNHEVEIIEFRKTKDASDREGQERRCCELCQEELGSGQQGCRGEGVVGCVDSCGGQVQERAACIYSCVANCQ